MDKQIKIRSQRVPRLIFRAGLVMLIIIAGLSFWSAAKYMHSSDLRKHTDQVITEIRGLRVSAENSESSMRGYLLTSQKEFANSYELSKKDMAANVANLKELTSDNQKQINRLQQVSRIIEDKTTFMDGVISLHNLGKKAEVEELVRDGQGRMLMASLQNLFNQLEDEERGLLTIRSNRADRDFHRTSIIVVVSILVAFGLLFIANHFLETEIKLRSEVEIKLQAAMKEANEASHLKSSFLANMSHEIRTPLNGIIGMAKLLEQTSLDHSQSDYVETIKTSSTSLLSLVNDILDLSKIESGKFQLENTNFELASLLKSAISIVDYSAIQKGLQITTHIGPNVPEFYVGDPLRLRQVLLNLLNNAIKFSDQGIVALKVTANPGKNADCVDLLFEIIDQGVGFDPEIKTKLFKSFSQGDDSTSRRYGGSGLGLAISKQIVELMNGSIDAESIKGVGSRFYFTVNLKLAKYDNTMTKTSLSQMTFRDLHGYVLIAEDNRVNQKVVVEMVKLLGCRTKVVENGEQALEALRREDFNLVLMDGQMPLMDGYEATRQIRAGKAGVHNRLIPILATTANAIKGDIERCLDAGMNDYISKPISYSDLALKIEKWLNQGKNVVDEEALQRTIQLGKKIGRPLLKELVDLFAQDSLPAISKMRTYLSDRNFEGLSSVAHSLKSSAANLGALRLKELADRIERTKNEASQEQMLLLINSLEKELRLVLEELAQRSESSACEKSTERPSEKPMDSSSL